MTGQRTPDDGLRYEPVGGVSREPVEAAGRVLTASDSLDGDVVPGSVLPGSELLA